MKMTIGHLARMSRNAMNVQPLRELALLRAKVAEAMPIDHRGIRPGRAASKTVRAKPTLN
jgi:hypothetical protein